MAEIKLELEIPLTLRSFRGAFVVFLVAALAGDLASESVTLTTFYPAPSGVYSQMTATQTSYFGRDTGYVAVGTIPVPAIAATTRLTVNGGLFAIGTLDPTITPGCPLGNTLCPDLDVNGSGGANVDLKVNGRIQTGDQTNTNLGGICLNPSCSIMVGSVKYGDGTYGFGILNNTASPSGFFINQTNGYVGIGFSPNIGTSAPAPFAPLDVNGTINVQGSVQCAVAPTPFSGGPGAYTAVCPGFTYATYAQGLYTSYQTASDYADDKSGSMYCCPCYGGVACPL